MLRRLWTRIANPGPKEMSIVVSGKQAHVADGAGRTYDVKTWDLVVMAGIQLAQKGDANGAETTFRQCIEFGGGEAVASASLNLGILLEQRGDVRGAEDAFQRAMDTQKVMVCAQAAMNLARLRFLRGDAPGASAAFQTAVDIGPSPWTQMAKLSLGMLYEEKGDLDQARSLYEDVASSDDVESADRAWAALQILNDRG